MSLEGPAHDEREAFQKVQNLSHEGLERFQHYLDLLTDYNSRHNLVSANSLEHVWMRHFLDSAQLYPLFPSDTKILADMGSGAGFPGMVLAILGIPEVHLIESIGKKAEFLRLVAKELNLPVIVRQDRLESIKDLRADIVTARALKSLPELLAYAKPLLREGGQAIFLKGRDAELELTEALKWWRFNHKIVPSISDASGRIIVVSDLIVTTKVNPAHDAHHSRKQSGSTLAGDRGGQSKGRRR